MSSTTIYYVYAYLRSKDSKTAKAGTPYYIGKGKGRRAFADSCHVVKAGNNPIVFLETNLSDTGALALERRMIKWYGRIDANTGILYNKTDGGDGAEGTIVSEETRDKHRGVNNHFYNKRHSESTKIKMRGLRPHCAGENNHNWKGGKQLKYSSESERKTAQSKFMLANNPMNNESSRKKISAAKLAIIKQPCPHCGKLFEPGGFAMHNKMLMRKGL